MSLFRVFVYGTLKAGEPNHHWLADKTNGRARLISEGTTNVQYPLVIATRFNIPFLLDVPGTGHHVNGEIYEVDEQMLARLDVLEDYPALYDRRLEPIRHRSDESVAQCWIYLLKKYPKYLGNLTMRSEYRNTPELPYTETYESDVLDK